MKLFPINVKNVKKVTDNVKMKINVIKMCFFIKLSINLKYI